MDLRQWMLADYKWAGRVLDMAVLAAVPPERLSERPAGVANSILWLFWHLARTEDLAMNTIVRAQPQVLEDGWASRLGVDDARIGTGLGDDEVAELSRTLVPGEVIAYWRAVRERTSQWLAEVPMETFDEVPDVDARLEKSGALPAQGDWLRQFWRGWKVGDFVRNPVINHHMQHLGEMMTIRGLMGIVPPIR